MKKKLAIAGSAVLAVLLLSGFAFRGGHGWGRDPERIRQMITWRLNDKLEDLDATDAQRQSINAVKDRLFDEGSQLMQEQHAARAEAFTQLASDTPDAQKLHALVDARIDAMRAFAHKLTDAALEVHGTLTPEQRKELATEFRERTGIK
ncbi:Spy/CpxP family protein refolding chaperone [Myxococcus sp. RHSTA-1-4]|uniref:Spy/CpxP family protein refolding chaperone n=1 Tax=Myxococcus sp. RHSTA-1-4 TaxID=2874601 RepID=UPI001CBC87B1|nr:Spy/CpxP family protein refolding chaperone [Myxococcus sp. RHSTA-1-4]MBZ4421796.1 Spy/CpxP family protein refolding chaperone [Myxococcus sp. RHSTA-1-4]